MSPSRTRGKPLFDPAALADDIDDLWPVRRPTPAAAQAVSAPTRRAGRDPDPPTPPPAVEPPPDTTLAAGVASLTAPPPASVSDDAPQLRAVAPVQVRTVKQRTRPPEVLLSAEVYDELYRAQIAEKKVRRGLARTMGAIVLDAIEAHASRLATTWTAQQYAVGEGKIFERPSSNAVPRRRRHATAPRTVVLSGVTAANAQRLDNLVQAWGAGTRSALVEQALRYEFGLLPA